MTPSEIRKRAEEVRRQRPSLSYVESLEAVIDEQLALAKHSNTSNFRAPSTSLREIVAEQRAVAITDRAMQLRAAHHGSDEACVNTAASELVTSERHGAIEQRANELHAAGHEYIQALRTAIREHTGVR